MLQNLLNVYLLIIIYNNIHVSDTEFLIDKDELGNLFI